MARPNDVTKGPKRWVRAERNHREHPNSQAAKLYASRILIAEQAATLATIGEISGVQPHQPFTFLKANWDYRTREAGPLKAEFRTCSVRCTVLQATVDRGVNTIENAVKLLKGEEFTVKTVYTYIPAGQIEEQTRVSTHTIKPNLEPLDRSTLTRDVRCMCCGGTIYKSGAPTLKPADAPVEIAPVKQPEVIRVPCTQDHVIRTDHVISARGNAIETADRVWVVSLTEREKELLELVADKTVFARRHGTPLSLALSVSKQDA